MNSTPDITEHESFQKVIDTAFKAAKTINDRTVIGKKLWMPFQLLYVHLAKQKAISTITDLPENIKQKYWAEACNIEPEAKTIKKIWRAQALYVYDQITKE